MGVFVLHGAPVALTPGRTMVVRRTRGEHRTARGHYKPSQKLYGSKGWTRH